MVTQDIDSNGSELGFTRTRTLISFELTCSWTDQADSSRTLRANELEAAKLEAASVRAVLAQLPSFKACKLSRKVRTEVYAVSFEFEAGDVFQSMERIG